MRDLLLQLQMMDGASGNNGKSLGTSIAVQNSGIGIPEQDLPYIFDRFYRVDKARNQKHGGSGLGLSIAKHLVQNYGGSISVQSEESVGTTFTIRLPILYF